MSNFVVNPFMFTRVCTDEYTFAESGTQGTASIKLNEQTGGFMLLTDHPLIGTMPTKLTGDFGRASALTTGTIWCEWRRTSDTTGSGTPLDTSTSVNCVDVAIINYGSPPYTMSTEEFEFSGGYSIEAGDYFLFTTDTATGNQMKYEMRTSNAEAYQQFTEWKTGVGLITNASYGGVTTITYCP